MKYLIFIFILFCGGCVRSNVAPLNVSAQSPVTVPLIVPLSHPKYKIAAAAFIKNEAKFLKEWIEFHRLMGVEHFYLFNHGSKDNFREVLQPYINEGIVELIDVLEKVNNWGEWNNVQCKTYSDLCKQTKDDVEWLILIDTDEFLFPTKENNLNDFLKNYADVVALSVNWKIYGSSQLEDIGPSDLLTELLIKSSDKAEADLHVKTIVRPRTVSHYINPHYPILLPGYQQVNEHKVPLEGPFLETPSRDFIRINHYWARTWKFFREEKLKRVHMIKKTEEFIKENRGFSIKEDRAISRFIPLLKANMGQQFPLSHTFVDFVGF